MYCLIVRRPSLEVTTKKASSSAGKNCWGSFSAMFAQGSAFLQLFPVVQIFLRFLGVICYGRRVLSEAHHSFLHSPKIRGYLVFEIQTKWEVMKKLHRKRGQFKGSSLRQGEGFQILSSVFLKKSMFSLLLEYFFLSGKYSPLLQSIDLFFHVVYVLLENVIL